MATASFSFLSLKGRTVTVSIYGAASAITPTPAATPFEYEESDSENLLDFVRYRTGNIRLIENYEGELDGLIPSSSTSHYVEVTYNGNLVFTGYLQCASFSTDYTAYPHEVSFPVVSPLGLLGSMYFTEKEPAETTIGALMQEVLEGLDSRNYSTIVYPSTTIEPWADRVRTRVVCAINAFKDKSVSSKSQALGEILEPKSYLYFVEGLCAALGWMIHDEPKGPTFVDYGYTGSYSSSPISTLGTSPTRSSYGQGTPYFSSQFTNNGDDATRTILRPLREIDIKCDGGNFENIKIPTDYGYNGSSSDSGDGGTSYYLTRYDSPFTSAITVSSACNSALQTWTSEASSASEEDGWDIPSSSASVSASMTDAVNTDHASLLKIDLQAGSSYNALTRGGWTSDIVVAISIAVGDLYYNPTLGGWYATSHTFQVTLNKTSGKVSTAGTMPNAFNDNDGVVIPTHLLNSLDPWGSATITASVALPSGTVGILNVTLVQQTTAKVDYKIKGATAAALTSSEIVSVSANINRYTATRNMNTFYPDGTPTLSVMPPSFGYMFYLRQMFRQRVTTSLNPLRCYASRYRYDSSTANTRIIALAFRPRDDEYTLTLIQSQTLS